MKRNVLRVGKRKTKRFLSFKESSHLILRLKPHLPTLFEPRDNLLRKNIFRIAEKYNIRIYRLVLNHSHMHGVINLPHRLSYVRFIREVTSFICMHFTKSIGIMGVVFKKIFSKEPFVRAVSWGRAFRDVLRYMDKNELESGVEQKSLDRFYLDGGSQLSLL